MRGFFGVVSHFDNATRVIQNLSNDLPHLIDTHTGQAIDVVILKTLFSYNVTGDQLGFFVFDTPTNNDAAFVALARYHKDFEPTYWHLCYNFYILYFIGQAIIFNGNKDPYENAHKHYNTEEFFIRVW